MDIIELISIILFELVGSGIGASQEEKVLKPKTLLIMGMLLLTFSAAVPSIFLDVPLAKAATWYTYGGEGKNFWINVTSIGGTVWNYLCQNSSLGITDTTRAEFTNFLRPNPSFGLIWSEMPAGSATTQRGQGMLSLIYGDDDVLVFKRERNSTTGSYLNRMTSIYTFWKDRQYFGYETRIERTDATVINQAQLGIFASESGANYVYSRLGYGGAQVGDSNRVCPVTYDLMVNSSSLYWQTMTRVSDNHTVGWILCYMDPPWMYASYAGAVKGEMQYQHIFSDPMEDFSYYSPDWCRVFQASTIIYFYDADASEGDPLYQETKDLSETLWQTDDGGEQSWESWDEWAQAYKYSDSVINRVGAFRWISGFGGFEIKNSTVWRMYPDKSRAVPYAADTPMSIYASSSTTFPNLAIEDGVGTTYITRVDQTYEAHSPNNPVTGPTTCYYRWRAELPSFAVWDTDPGNIYTQGNSDKFNITFHLKTTVNINISRAWTAFNVQPTYMGRDVIFNDITPDVTGDWAYEDFNGQYTGILLKKVAGNAEVVTNSTGFYIFFVDGPTYEYAPGEDWWITIMVWLHGGVKTSEYEITPFASSVQMPDLNNNYIKHPINSTNLCVEINSDYHPISTFPVMRNVNSTHYKILALGNGNHTYTVFLNQVKFPLVSLMTNVTAWDYDPITGNLTFSVSLANDLWLFLSNEPLGGNNIPVTDFCNSTIQDNGNNLYAQLDRAHRTILIAVALIAFLAAGFYIVVKPPLIERKPHTPEARGRIQ